MLKLERKSFQSNCRKDVPKRSSCYYFFCNLHTEKKHGGKFVFKERKEKHEKGRGVLGRLVKDHTFQYTIHTYTVSTPPKSFNGISMWERRVGVDQK